MKILIIEDELPLLNSLKSFLMEERFTVETATNFSAALDKIAAYIYDCVLLDINLPDGSGLEILKQLKDASSPSNVIIISARNSTDDKIQGLDLGADDYLTKPFHLAELLARIKAVVRRKNFNGQNVLAYKSLSIDINERMAYVNQTPLTLSRKEFDILLFFVSNPERLVTKEVLAENVWGDNFDCVDNFEFIYAQVKNIRRRLKQANAGVSVQAVYGIGYKLMPE